MMARNLRLGTLVGILLLVVALPGCGPYSASPGRVDESIKRVAVLYLENLTAEPNLDVDLTDAIIAALQVDNTLRVVPEGEAGRIVGDDLKYNRVAAGVMKKHGVTINDLNTLTRGFDASYFTLPGDVHYKPVGSHKIAEQVVTAIRAKLKK